MKRYYTAIRPKTSLNLGHTTFHPLWSYDVSDVAGDVVEVLVDDDADSDGDDGESDFVGGNVDERGDRRAKRSEDL